MSLPERDSLVKGCRTTGQCRVAGSQYSWRPESIQVPEPAEFPSTGSGKWLQMSKPARMFSLWCHQPRSPAGPGDPRPRWVHTRAWNTACTFLWERQSGSALARLNVLLVGGQQPQKGTHLPFLQEEGGRARAAKTA